MTRSPIQLLVLDLDGVFTDGRVSLGFDGQEFKAVDLRDVDALVAARRQGLAVAFLTGEATPWIDRLVERTGVDLVIRGEKDKLAGLHRLASTSGLALDRICYVGDAVRDVPALRAAGLGIAPANAVPEAKAASDVVTRAAGGDGAIREVLNLLERRADVPEETAPDETDRRAGPVTLSETALEDIRQAGQESADVIARVSRDLAEPLARAAELVLNAMRSGGKLLVFGNGGSAAESQHLVGEFVGRFGFDRAPLPAITLSADTSVLTALVNDYPPELVFARQVWALGRPGDVAIGLTTSGRSRNVVEALRAARELRCGTVALTGRTGGPVAEHADILLPVGSTVTPRIQEGHLFLIHQLADLVERAVFPRPTA